MQNEDSDRLEEIQVINKPESKQEETILSNEKANVKEKSSGCKYHMGYLSEREKNQQIPDECIVCGDIVGCMLKKMRT